jgi:membrane-associated phospholipid phosphatase
MRFSIRSTLVGAGAARANVVALRRPSIVLAATAFAAAFAALAVLVATGILDGVDRFAVDHLMPGLDARHSGKPSLLQALSPVSRQRGPFDLAADAWLYPASVPVSGLIVTVAAAALWRRGRRIEPALWLGALVVGTAIEVLVKGTVKRQALFATDDGARIHVIAFDDSLPSGHALRSAILVAAIAVTWQRYGPVALAWAVTVPPLLLLAGWHTPTDIVAGSVLALLLVLLVRAASADDLERRPVDLGPPAPAPRHERQPAGREP